MAGRRFAVVDCETTGLYNHDRVIEVAVVVVDASSGSVIDEYDTLINPMRDTGPIGIHGITPSMVQLAATFDEVGEASPARQRHQAVAGVGGGRPDFAIRQGQEGARVWRARDQRIRLPRAGGLSR